MQIHLAQLYSLQTLAFKHGTEHVISWLGWGTCSPPYVLRFPRVCALTNLQPTWPFGWRLYTLHFGY